jgi:hypothetical protein
MAGTPEKEKIKSCQDDRNRLAYSAAKSDDWDRSNKSNPISIFKKLFGGGSGTDGGGETPEFKRLLETSMADLQAKTAGHRAGWGLGESKRWDLDQSRGDLIFTFSDGVIATCPAQIIGSFDTDSSTWLWAWANPSIHDSLKRDSLRVRDYGQQHKIARLTSAQWSCTEADAWAMAALSCKLCEAQGIYRGPAGPSFVFISFGQVALSKSQNA